MSENNSGTRTPNRCAFCGRDEMQVDFLIPAPSGVCICDFCVDLCAQLIEENSPEEKPMKGEGEDAFDKLSMETLPKPKQIKSSLEE